MNTLELVLAAAVFCAAYVVRGIAGFGSALVAVPLLGLLLPLPLLVPVVIALDLMGSAGQAWANRAQIVWSDLWPLAPFTLLGIGTALTLFAMLDAEALSLALGLFVIAFGIYQVLPLPALRAGRVAAAPYGFLGGLVGTMFGAGGPFYVIYLGMRGLPKVGLRASFAAWFVADGGVRLIGFGLFGHYGVNTLVLLAVGVPAAIVGLRIGGRIHTGLDQAQFRRLISVLLVLSGIALVAKS